MKKILFSSFFVLLLSTAAFSQSNSNEPQTDFAIISFFYNNLDANVSIVYSDGHKDAIGKFKAGDELNSKLAELYSKLASQGFEFISDSGTRISFVRKIK